MRGKRVAVTGGAGFIGSNLARAIAAHNQVIIIDDLSTGKRENLEALSKNEDVRFIEGSVCNLCLLQETFKGLDYVFHEAAIASVPRAIENPSMSHEANVTGTLNVLLAARDNRVQKVIYASSSSVYGDASSLPNREDMSPNPLSAYAVTKLAGEYYCQIFHQIYGLPTICLRYFNVYGPGQDPNSEYAAVIPRFIAAVSKGELPVIFGDGDQTRDFIFIKDVLEATTTLAESDATGVFNIGSGTSVTINQLASIVLGIMGKDLQPLHREPRSGDIRHSLADTAKAAAFGCNCRYRLEDGLRETINWLIG